MPLTIYNPFSTQVVAGKATRQAFAGNVIPANLISPVGAAVLNAMPLPNLPGTPQIGAFNWSEDKTYTVGQQEESVRIDHNISSRQRIFGRFSRLTRNQNPEVLIPGVHQYNGSGANIDHYQQWRNAVTLDDTDHLLADAGRLLPLWLRAPPEQRDLGRRRHWIRGQFHLPAVVIGNQSIQGLSRVQHRRKRAHHRQPHQPARQRPAFALLHLHQDPRQPQPEVRQPTTG